MYLDNTLNLWSYCRSGNICVQCLQSLKYKCSRGVTSMQMFLLNRLTEYRLVNFNYLAYYQPANCVTTMIHSTLQLQTILTNLIVSTIAFNSNDVYCRGFNRRSSDARSDVLFGIDNTSRIIFESLIILQIGRYICSMFTKSRM